MRLYLVCDDDDTEVGLRLAGVEGTRVRSAEEARAQILAKAAQDDIGVILINRSLMRQLGDFPTQFREKHTLPVLTEIPDTSGLPAGGSVARYVREAVGIHE